MNSTDYSASRRPPYSEEAEKGVLGSLITDSERVYELCISRNISSDHFYIPAHRLMYEQIVNMRRENIPFDILTIGEKLKQNGRLDQVGGYTFLQSVLDSTPTSAHAEYYINIIIEMFVRRQWIQTFATGMDMAYSSDIEEIGQMLSEAEDKISKAVNANQLQTDHIALSAQSLEDSINLKAPVIRKVKSSINTVSNRVLGYACGKMTVIAARPSKGKTSWACSECLGIALRGESVSILTLEMTAEEYTARIACIHGNIPVEKYIDGKLSEEEREILRMSLQQVARLPIRINAKNMNFKQVREWIRKESKHSEVLIIDLFTKIRRAGGKRFSSDQAEWSHMARVLSDDVKTYGCAFLLLHQIHRINKWAGKEKNPMPQLDDLKDTGALEEEAYMVVLLHDAPVDKDNPSAGNYMAIIPKHRNGWTGICPVTFVPEYTEFKGLGQ